MGVKEPEKVMCKYCNTIILLSQALITNDKGRFAGYSCGCHLKKINKIIT